MMEATSASHPLDGGHVDAREVDARALDVFADRLAHSISIDRVIAGARPA